MPFFNIMFDRALHTSLSFTSMERLPIEAKKKFIVALAVSAHVSQSSVALAVTVISQSKMLLVERYEGMLAKGSGTAIWSIQTSPVDQVTSPQEHVHGWHYHSDWNGI
jgi:hypothetical protein